MDLKLVLSDAGITFLWVFLTSCIGAVTEVIGSYLHLMGLGRLCVVTALVAVLVVSFASLSQKLGGASFNPAALVAFSTQARGLQFSKLAFRFPAQMVGAVAGALSILELMPASYSHTLGGPQLKVDLHTGAIAEGVLTCLSCFFIMLVIFKGPRNSIIQNSLIVLSTITLILLGAGYTGPAMNPANAFGWAYVNKRHSNWEHFYVYWLTPLIGAFISGLLLRKDEHKEKTA